MEAEINQTIHTANTNTQVYLFEFLKDWLNDWRITSVHQREIFRVADEYNERTEKAYLAKIEEQDAEFRKSADYNSREHLEEYEQPKVFESPYPKWINHYFGGDNKKVFKKFICRLEGPELIDYPYLREYFDFVDGILSNFRRIVNKYVSLYDAGKIVSSVDKITERMVLAQAEPPALPPPTSKIKTDLSVPQLAYFFKLLYEVKPEIFPGLTKADLYRFIAANFITKGKGDAEISVDSLSNHFNSPEKKTAEFWAAYLKKMLEQSRKE